MNSTKDTFSIHWELQKNHGILDGTKVLDIGTGGGFGNSFSDFISNAEFTLVDSIGKKLR